MSDLSKDPLEAIGRCCPVLKTLKFNKETGIGPFIEEAFATAGTMPELRHLQLLGNKLTNHGSLAILDGCTHLESLDLRCCDYVDLRASLGTRCAEQIKDLRLPDDPIDFDDRSSDYVNYGFSGGSDSDNNYDDYCDF